MERNSLKLVPVERISADRPALVADYFETGPAHPAVLVGAVRDWPALRKWNLAFFASEFRGELGVAAVSFEHTKCGKATRLGAFIDHLDEPFSSMPGLWFGLDGKPGEAPPRFDEKAVWAFNWDAFRRHPGLFDDISPFPSFIPNMVSRLPLEVAEGLESITGVRFYAIYISRRNTITPLHRDFHHTIGSLLQLQGDKKVFLFGPQDPAAGDRAFDPENPDYERFPQMVGRSAYSTTLRPGELIIIPPDWLHYTRSLDHSVTLSHNFFNHLNVSEFVRCVRDDLDRKPDKRELFERISPFLESSGPAGAP